MRRGRVALVLAAAVVVTASVGCADQADRYCDAVVDNQDRLSEIADSGDTVALFEARDVYAELAEQAPDDITDDWRLVIDRIDALETALDEADVDPATYDAEEPPADLTGPERARIRQAADGLLELDTIRAQRDVEQQALDVCGTPLRP